MFYSQFILAKKGPLGTIWIAAHLERKLRKNQVADTDIGVSVDSILSPGVPIALRLSSHLLLGVVRIYSRKVNYLFDECSEALLKIKQAFRSTAVDLPPEETTAPYHSITLPETFDLDDFELPDSDIFQGSYVDHHISTREQITLQDSMESLVTSTTQFGLDERFGDGDASGLDLGEELLFNKVAAPGHARAMMGSDAEPYAFVQPTTPLEHGKDHEGLNGNSDVLVATVGIIQLEDLVGNADLVEYAHSPGTPGLMEEPSLSKHEEASVCEDHLELGEEQNFSHIQEASASDDHLESKYHNLKKFVDKENLANVTRNSGCYFGNGNAGDLSLLSDMSPVAFLGGQGIKQVKSPGDSPSTAGKLLSDEPIKSISPVSEFPHTNFYVFGDSNRVEDLRTEVVSNNAAGSQSIDCDRADSMEPQGAGLHETVSRSNFPHEGHGLEGSFGISCTAITNISVQSRLSSTCQPSSEGILEISQASLSPEGSYNVENAGNIENSCSPSYEVESNAGPPGRQDHGNPETQACQDPKDSIVLSPVVDKTVAAADMHVLQPWKPVNQQGTVNPGSDVSVAYQLSSGVIELSSLETSGRQEAPCAPGASTEVQGEGSHVDFMEPVLEENYTTEPASCEDIQADISKLNNEVSNMVSGYTQLELLDGSQNSELPAPENLLSVPEALADLRDNLLVESTPDKAHLAISDGGDAGMNNISGKKRSFSESTLTVESLNSVESLVAQSNVTNESVPDDNDLLSSILVGRRSSVLKLKPTPTLASEITSMKRPRSAPRVSASKRKVLVDDSMVLHGDAIRQQLTSTEDIRRVRKKAPCTRPEIWVIQKELWEDEIFSEPVFTGLSTELILCQGQTYDLSEITVSQDDVQFSYVEAAVDLNFISKKTENNPWETENEMELSMQPNVYRKTGTISESMVIRNDGKAESSGNQDGEEHVLLSQVYYTREQMGAICDMQEPRSLTHEHSREITETEIDGPSVRVADAVNPAVSMVSSVLLDKENGGDGVLQMDGSGLPLDQRLGSQSVDADASIVCLSSGKGVDDSKVEEEDDVIAAVGRTKSTARDGFLLEQTDGDTSFAIGADLQMPYCARTETENGSLVMSPEAGCCSNQVLVTIDQTMKESNEQRAVNEDEVIAAELGFDVKNMTGSNGEPKESSSSSVDLNVDSKNACSNDGKYPGCQEAGLQCIIDTEVAIVGQVATEDHDDFDCTLDGHDTGFLNVDDDDVVEEDDDYVPNAEQTSFLENSGWSSRTRAVAKYLQVLFVKEAENGRKVLPMDNLLVGKTRKEASRMFFEALVLKTRDYIHVEQGAPFDNINVKPRVKLIKSDF